MSIDRSRTITNLRCAVLPGKNKYKKPWVKVSSLLESLINANDVSFLETSSAFIPGIFILYMSCLSYEARSKNTKHVFIFSILYGAL